MSICPRPLVRASSLRAHNPASACAETASVVISAALQLSTVSVINGREGEEEEELRIKRRSKLGLPTLLQQPFDWRWPKLPGCRCRQAPNADQNLVCNG